jgi:hypothetical protein
MNLMNLMDRYEQTSSPILYSSVYLYLVHYHFGSDQLLFLSILSREKVQARADFLIEVMESKLLGNNGCQDGIMRPRSPKSG